MAANPLFPSTAFTGISICWIVPGIPPKLDAPRELDNSFCRIKEIGLFGIFLTIAGIQVCAALSRGREWIDNFAIQLKRIVMVT